jgi:hypothetical protein
MPHFRLARGGLAGNANYAVEELISVKLHSYGLQAGMNLDARRVQLSGIFLLSLCNGRLQRFGCSYSLLPSFLVQHLFAKSMILP